MCSPLLHFCFESSAMNSASRVVSGKRSRYARSPMAAFTREESVSTSIVTLKRTRVADAWRCRSNKGFSGSGTFRPLKARVRLLLLLADGGSWHIGSSPVFRLNHGAPHFCSGGDAPASPLCLPQVTPVQLRAATSSLNHPAGCAASTRGLRRNVVQLS